MVPPYLGQDKYLPALQMTKWSFAAPIGRKASTKGYSHPIIIAAYIKSSKKYTAAEPSLYAVAASIFEDQFQIILFIIQRYVWIGL